MTEELTTHRLITLLGAGGVGKTRLSLEAALAARPDIWQDGPYVAELAPVRDADGVPEAVLTALGARETHVAACRAEKLDWELGFLLLMRAKLLHDASGDADEALAIFEAAQDAWGIAESLCARGEANERAGRDREAAADFAAAMRAAADIGARTQVPVFKARLAGLRLITASDTQERERAERMLVEAADEADEFGTEGVSTARLLLLHHYARTDRHGPAREQLRRIEDRFGDHTPGLFRGMALSLHGWLDCLDGACERAAARLTRAVHALEPLAYLVAPYVVVGQFPAAAWAKAAVGPAEDGARLLGAYDRHSGMPGGPASAPSARRPSGPSARAPNPPCAPRSPRRATRTPTRRAAP